MRVSFLVAAVFLAGCAQAPDLPGNVPPILFAVNNQAHILVLQGVEGGNATWGLVDVQVTGDASCSVKAPREGGMEPGQAVHVLSDEGAQCIVSARYDGVSLGTWTFQPPVPVSETLTKTASPSPSASQTASTTPKPPQGNGTVPPP